MSPKQSVMSSQRQYTRILNVISTEAGTAATLTDGIPESTFFTCEILQRIDDGATKTFERTGEFVEVRNDYDAEVPDGQFLKVAYEENGEVAIIVWPCE